MILLRRRPLLRGAVVGGAAYHIGKKNAQNQQAQEEQAAADQAAENQKAQERMAQDQANAQAAAGSKGGSEDSGLNELTKLQRLHDNGVLTDKEFASAKKKVIDKM